MNICLLEVVEVARLPKDVKVEIEMMQNTIFFNLNDAAT